MHTLSHGQQALRLIHQLLPESSAYNVPLAWWVAPPVNHEMLRAAFERVIERHEPLRTVYPLTEDGFIQRLDTDTPLDFKAYPVAPVEPVELLKALREEAYRPFDLARGPVFRVRLWVRPSGPALLLVVAHHIALDGWSIRLLLEELGTCYAAFHRGRAPELPRLATTYREYAARLAERLEGADGQRLRDYWLGQLEGAPTVLEMPFDRSRPMAPSDHGDAFSDRLSEDLVERARGFARRHRITPFTVLLAAFQVLLHRYTGQDDVLVGTPTAGRRGAGGDALIGYFINPLVLRADLSGDPTFEVFLARAREVVLDAFDHQDYPFGRLAEDLEPERDFGRHPVFQAVFTMLPPPPPELPDLYAGRMGFSGGRLELGDLVLEPIPLDEGAARFDLTLLVAGKGDELALRLQYDAHLFDATTAQRLVHHYRTLLTAALERPHIPLSALPVWDPAQYHQLIVEGNSALPTPPFRESVQERFARQVRRRPDAVALVFDEERWSYGELARRVRQLTIRLNATEVEAETKVGICMGRSAKLIAAILGVVATGGAYVPMDPAYPEARLRLLIEDSGVELILTDRTGEKRLHSMATRTLRVDETRPDDEAVFDPSTYRVAPVEPHQLAYIIYTSGSTGRPKGVGVTQANVARLLSSTRPWFDFGPGDVWTLFHSYAFDFSVWEMWGALASGGRLVVVPEMVRTSPRDFRRLLLERRVTVLNQTPSAFRQLIAADEEADPAETTALRRVIFGGEALDLESLRPWMRRHGDERPRLVNMYGITETTVHVTHRSLTKTDVNAVRGSLIGHPIPDLEVRVLDRHQRPAPLGVAGELCVGGAGLARGYLGRAGRTAERFIPDPFGERSGDRLYRSGDLARHLAEGDLEYLGRIDSQVKVRGHRIELGEVQASLAEHPQLREVAVVTRGPTDAIRLVAYVVPRGALEAGPSVESMRDFLSRRLPEYMVPALFVVLGALPMTAHGKLDREALPEPAVNRSALKQAYVAPRTQIEAVLATVWADVLGVERVGRHDAFFTLGGDSIRGVRVVSEARRRGLSFSLQDLFRHGTVAGLAREAVQAPTDRDEDLGDPTPFSLLAEEDRSHLPPGLEDAYPLTMLQTGMILEGERAAATPLYHNVNGMLLQARLDPMALHRAITTLIARHPVLRSSFRLDGFTEPVQLVHRRVTIPCPLVDLSGLEATDRTRETERWLAAEAQRRYPLEQAPLMRFVAHRLDDEVFYLGFSEHHVLADGWSMAVVRSELLRLYATEMGDPAPQLPSPPRTPFAAFVASERRAVQDREARRFWRREMAGAPFAHLPRRTGRGFVPRRVEYRGVPLNELTSAGLERLARSEGVSLKSVLLAAHLRVLSRITGETDLVTGVVSHGRPETNDGERIVGLFVNSLPLRATVAARPGREMVADAAAAERRMLAYRVFPLAEIQAVAGGRRLFETLFNFVHFHVSDTLGRLSRVQLLERHIHAETELPLVVTFRRSPSCDRLEARLEGNVGELDEVDLHRFAGFYARALHILAEEPEALATDPLLWPAERHRLLMEWSSGPQAPPPVPLMTLFAHQVARRPDAPALIAGHRELTYAELDAAAQRLARRLRHRGVDREVRVGLLLERSAEAITALLAVLQAGGTYVPLDPAYPEERLRGMLRDADVALVITRGAEPIPNLQGVPRLDLDAESTSPEPKSRGRLPLATSIDNLAYVMFTSGSTGRPKAVAVTHGGVARLLADGDFAHLGPEESWLQLSPLTFDGATLEIWGALGRGGRLVVIPPGPASLRTLGRVIRQHGVTSMMPTTGLFHRMIQEDPEPLRPLRQVLAGGDVLSPTLARRFLAAAPGTRLNNGYGPTENTTYTACHPMQGATGAVSITSTVPLGRPISHTRVYVVDADLLPAPAGAAGEVVTGGAGLARGYLGQPARTAESFVPDPFAESTGERLYRTGDLARWNADGRLEFLGRRDGQIKVRGFRVETAEVVAALEHHPAVREAVVVARGEGAEDKELVAYVIAPEAPPEDDELRTFLSARLPAFMIPSRICRLEAFPLDPNGKVDRRALPAPEVASQDGRAPRNLVEELVTRVWSDLLEVEPVGVDDDLFALGAHSLTAVSAASRLRQAFDREVPLELLFEHPTPAGQAAAIEALTEIPTRPPLTPRLPSTEAPLSPAQERLWFFHRLEPQAPTYNVPLIHTLSGPLRATSLATALAVVVERHGVLRTIYRSRTGGPVQTMLPPGAPGTPSAEGILPRVDLSALPSSRRRRVARTLSEEAARRPFDLSIGPPMRARLLTLGPEEHFLVLVIHHMSFDGASVTVLHRELAAVYGAGSAPPPSPSLPPLPVQYADYAIWQRQQLQTEASRTSREHWHQRLAGCSGLEIPSDRPRPAVRTSRGGRIERPLTRPWIETADALAQGRAATRFMLFAAVFTALLARFTDRTDVVFGTPSGHRDPPSLEPLLGCFINPLMLRVDAGGDPEARELVDRVRQRVVTDYPHAGFPFELLVEELVPQRDLARPPLFQILFAVQDTEAGELALDGLRVEPCSVDLKAAKYDLVVEVVDSPHRPGLAATYSTELFDATTVARFLRAFETLVSDAAAHPQRRLSQLTVLSPGERHQLLREWSDTQRNPGPGTVPQWIKAQIHCNPDRVAVEAEEAFLTYGELDRRANALAHRLRRMGAGPETPVAVALLRTADLLVTLLGIFKTGACYVPLDPGHPRQRQTWVLEDSAAPLLVTHDHLYPEIAHGTAEPVRVEDPVETSDAQVRLEVAHDPRQLAYSIFTSGSTGRPKGVQVSHGALSNLVSDMARHVGLTAAKRMLAITPLSFDISAFELLGTLAMGGTVILTDSTTATMGTTLAKRLEETGAEFMQATPATWRLLVASGWQGTPGLVALCGGEALPDPLAMELIERCDQLWNLYGPTEATIYSTAARLRRESPVSLGRPIANTRIHVASKGGRACPLTVPGEVLIGGSGLARGYLGKSSMTAERFVPDPFSGLAGERLYRTGDLGRLRADGELSYLGRLDHQIKLRGFRIELGEIETALQSHPEVSAAVVGLRGAAASDHRLVAWYTAAKALPIERLTSFLGEILPDYMVPAAFVHLEAFPQTPNRKIDRQALPEPGTERPHLEVRYLAPRSELERTVAEVWRQVLGIDRVGLDDNFFDLGGSSLLAIEVLDRLAVDEARPLTLVDLFRFPTVGALAARLDNEPSQTERLATVSERAARRRRARETRRKKR